MAWVATISSSLSAHVRISSRAQCKTAPGAFGRNGRSAAGLAMAVSAAASAASSSSHRQAVDPVRPSTVSTRSRAAARSPVIRRNAETVRGIFGSRGVLAREPAEVVCRGDTAKSLFRLRTVGRLPRAGRQSTRIVAKNSARPTRTVSSVSGPIGVPAQRVAMASRRESGRSGLPARESASGVLMRGGSHWG